MAGELEARLAAAAEAVRERELTAQRCEELERWLDELNHWLTGLRAEHAAEVDDVGRLEGISLTRVLAALRGAREDRLAQEQAQAAAAALRVNDATWRLAALQREYEAARTRLWELSGAPEAYAAVLDEKDRHLRSSGDPRAPRILDLADERGRLTGEVNELHEALEAALTARHALTIVRDQLGSASSWSTYDTFFGGGFISSAIKHDRLDDAAAAAAHADRCLAVLRTELADVGGAGLTAPRLGFDGLTRFLDVWFDNVFTDWSVRSRIQEAQRNVAGCLGMLAQAHARLEHAAATTRARLAAVESERHDLLTRDPPP
ncbi:MAG TPA: hypothetical protein VK611_30835 [Acidimicrobiales bacterium]|nr:hypothetical protein [Acidimicrobiales bacterium]